MDDTTSLLPTRRKINHKFVNVKNGILSVVAVILLVSLLSIVVYANDLHSVLSSLTGKNRIDMAIDSESTSEPMEPTSVPR